MTRRIALAIAACAGLFVCAPAFADDGLAGVGELITSGRVAEARTRLGAARDAFVAQGAAPPSFRRPLARGY